MATTDRPFDYSKRNYIDLLNDLFNVGMPRLLVNPSDPESATGPVTGNRTLVFEDNGGVADVLASSTLTLGLSCMQDGWCVFVNVVIGTATINAATEAGTTFHGGATTKTITAGNGAIISSDGVNFRIFRFTTT